jgi:hypothetical protein
MRKTKPEIESVAGYRKGQAPDAAKFGVGISDRAGAQQAQDAARDHGREIASRPTSPSRPIKSVSELNPHKDNTHDHDQTRRHDARRQY